MSEGGKHRISHNINYSEVSLTRQINYVNNIYHQTPPFNELTHTFFPIKILRTCLK